MTFEESDCDSEAVCVPDDMGFHTRPLIEFWVTLLVVEGSGDSNNVTIDWPIAGCHKQPSAKLKRFLIVILWDLTIKRNILSSSPSCDNLIQRGIREINGKSASFLFDSQLYTLATYIY